MDIKDPGGQLFIDPPDPEQWKNHEENEHEVYAFFSF
jgi:hypothetical protein